MQFGKRGSERSLCWKVRRLLFLVFVRSLLVLPSLLILREVKLSPCVILSYKVSGKRIQVPAPIQIVFSWVYGNHNAVPRLI